MNVATTIADTTTTTQPPRRLDLLALFGFLSILTLGLGGWLTSLGFGPWYDELKKPWFQPPGWVFSPVWTVIFVLLAFATWQIARCGRAAKTALVWYGVQLLLNVGWSLLFFTLHQPFWALVEILVLDAVVIVMVILYARLRPAAGFMLVPYACWLILATAINIWIVVYN